jgi:electron transfer flavoprotein alpha subunit
MLHHCRRLLSASASTSKVSALVVAELHNGNLAKDTGAAVAAALQAVPNSTVGVLIAGHGPTLNAAAEQAAKLKGVSNVFVASHPSLEHRLPETVAPLVAQLSAKVSASHVFASANTTIKSVFPRLAAILDKPLISDILEVRSPTNFQRPTYAGNALVEVSTSESPVLVTVRPTSFESVEQEAAPAAQISQVDDVESLLKTEVKVPTWVKDDIAKSDRPELASARVVVSGGRGLKSGENFALLYELADLLKGAVGASRAAVDAGFVGNDLQVGQTGKVVAPDLYIAVGISGAIQHLAGMKDSKVIVAINKDPEAPIFQVSDYGIVADLFKAVPELTEALKKTQ